MASLSRVERLAIQHIRDADGALPLDSMIAEWIMRYERYAARGLVTITYDERGRGFVREAPVKTPRKQQPGERALLAGLKGKQRAAAQAVLDAGGALRVDIEDRAQRELWFALGELQDQGRVTEEQRQGGRLRVYRLVEAGAAA